MGISKKTLLIVSSILGAIIISLFFYLRFNVLPYYIESEKVTMTNNIIQVSKSLNKEADFLEKTAAAIAASSAGPEGSDILQKIFAPGTAGTFDIDLGLSLTEGLDGVKAASTGAANLPAEITFAYYGGQKINPGTADAIPGISSFLASPVFHYVLEKAASTRSPSSTFTVIGEKPFIIASAFIPGTSSAFFVAGQEIDNYTAGSLSLSAGNPVNIYLFSNPQASQKYSSTISSLQGSNLYLTDYLDSGRIAGYTLIRDHDAEPVLLLEIISDRSIYIQSRNNIYSFLLLLFFTGVFSCLAIFLVLEKSVLSRISELSRKAEEIGKSRDISRCIPFRGRDEIASLAISINGMLRELKKNQLDLLKSEKRFKDLVELLPEVVIESNAENVITFANKSFYKVMGYTIDDIRPGPLRVNEIFFPQDRKKEAENISRLSKGEKIESSEYMAVRKDNTTFPVLASMVARFDEKGALSGYRYIAIDITNMKAEEARVKELEARWEFALEGSGDGVWDWDFANREVFYSKKLKEILGFDENEINNDLNEIMGRIHPEDYKMVMDQINMHLSGENPYYSAEYRIKRRDGSYMWVQDRGKVIRWDDTGKPVRMIGTFTDITERKEFEEEIRSLAYRDPLTNLPNRHLFNDRIELTIEHSKRYGKSFALMVIDIDRFKKINDTYGHNFGDKLILYVGNVIRNLLRKSDTIARFGGDEFLILVPDIKDKEGAERIAEKIMQSFRGKTVLEGKKISLTLSIGIALFPDNGEDTLSLFKNADKALYEVKAGGRNNYRFFEIKKSSTAAAVPASVK